MRIPGHWTNDEVCQALRVVSDELGLGMSAGQEPLAAWLLAHGLAEELPGYGHVTADDLAERLLDAFDIYYKELS